MDLCIKEEPYALDLDGEASSQTIQPNTKPCLEPCNRCKVLAKELDVLKEKYSILLQKLETMRSVEDREESRYDELAINTLAEELNNHIASDNSTSSEVSPNETDPSAGGDKETASNNNEENFVDVGMVLEQDLEEGSNNLEDLISEINEVSTGKKNRKKPQKLTLEAQPEKEHQCMHCEEKFEKLKQLDKHLLIHVGPNRFQCMECGKVCDKRSSLQKHMRSHTGEKLFQCDICENWFSHSSALTAHKRIHSGEKPYGCQICGRFFSQSASLSGHMRTHTGEKPFQCTQCGKCYGKKTALNVHMRKHTGEKPFSCTVCGQRFSEKARVVVHMRRHTGERPHICEVCGKGCSRSNDLSKHMRTHSTERPFPCDKCDSAFHEVFFLKRHIKDVHTEEKAYACRICGKKFSRSNDLDRHFKNSHIGIRPFACNLCDKTYGEKYGLARHVKSHDSLKPPRKSKKKMVAVVECGEMEGGAKVEIMAGNESDVPLDLAEPVKKENLSFEEPSTSDSQIFTPIVTVNVIKNEVDEER